ncbi:hypothetical protein FKM82_029508 [Ascaphus truei]
MGSEELAGQQRKPSVLPPPRSPSPPWKPGSNCCLEGREREKKKRILTKHLGARDVVHLVFILYVLMD